MAAKEPGKNNADAEKISIDEFRNLFMQNLKGSFFKNDPIKKSYFLEGTICSDVERHKYGTSFKIQSDEGSVMNVFIPKKSGYHSGIEPGNKINLFGMFNIYDNNIENQFNFIEFKASRVIESDVSDSKKEAILSVLNEKGFLDKPKKNLVFENVDFFKLMIISSKDSTASAEIVNCLKSTNFFEVSIHYIDTYKSDDIVELLNSMDKNHYYDAIMITGIGSLEKRLFDELNVLEAIAGMKSPIITAMGRCLADEVADMTEDGPLTAARMLLYTYKESKYKNNDSPMVPNEHNSNLFITMNQEKEDLERKLSTMFNDKVTLLNKIQSQQKLMFFLSVVCIITVIFYFIK
jgi:exonuclease VII large subunit